MSLQIISISWAPLCCLLLQLTSGDGLNSEKMDVADLYRLGAKERAPFSDDSIKRLSEGKMGSSTARRSVDVIIINKLHKFLVLHESACLEGEFIEDYWPEEEMSSKSSSVYGIQSTGQTTGVSCAIKYEIEDERDGQASSFVKIGVTYPMDGEMVHYTESRGFVKVRTTEVENQIRFVLEPTPRKRVTFKDVKVATVINMERL